MRGKKPFKAKFRAVIFDLDGVLIFSFDAWYHIFNDTLEHFGYKKISREMFDKYWGESTEDDVRRFMPERTVPEVKAHLEAVYDKHAERHVRLNDAAIPSLKALRARGLKIACATNSHRGMTDRILARFGLKGNLDFVATADDVKRPKPAPDMVLASCAALGVEPREAAFVGDTECDIKAGRAAGVYTVGYRLDGGDARADSLEEFIGILSGEKT